MRRPPGGTVRASRAHWQVFRRNFAHESRALPDFSEENSSEARDVENLRELENAIERAVAFARGPVIAPDDLPERVRTSGGASVLIARSVEQNMTIREMEREYILEVLRRTGGNKSRAAELLGLDRKTLYRRLDEYRAEGAPGL